MWRTSASLGLSARFACVLYLAAAGDSGGRTSQGRNDGQRWMARASACAWEVAAAPLVGNETNTLAAAAVRVTVKHWEFGGTRHNALILSKGELEVTLQTNKCVLGQECALDTQCVSRAGLVVGRCNWTGTDTLEMPPEFTLALHSGINSINPLVQLVIQVRGHLPCSLCHS